MARNAPRSPEHRSPPSEADKARRFGLDPAIGQLLATMPDANDTSRGFRHWLRRAGVTRAELFDETSDTRKAISCHDLRATYCTWRAIRGDDAHKIMRAAGHADIETTMVYVREAESLRDGFGDMFPALPALALDAETSNQMSKSLGTSRNYWRRGRDVSRTSAATPRDSAPQVGAVP